MTASPAPSQLPPTPSAAVLPAQLPILAVPGLLLLPGTRLPLNIFDPADIAMVDYALGKGRLIGLIQPRQENAVTHDAPLYDVGCAGRVTSFTETGDGRFLIGLSGVIRFRVEKTLSHDAPQAPSFRLVEPNWTPFLDDLQTSDEDEDIPFNQTRLMEALRGYFKIHGVAADWNALQEASSEELIAMLAMTCPFSGCEKQALLEAPTVQARAEMLTSLLEMGSLQNQDFDEAKH